MTQTTLSNQIQKFLSSLLNSRGRLLKAGIGNTSDPLNIKHEQLKKAYDYAVSIGTNEIGWCRFIQKWEQTIRYLIIHNKSRSNKEFELTQIILSITKSNR